MTAPLYKYIRLAAKDRDGTYPTKKRYYLVGKTNGSALGHIAWECGRYVFFPEPGNAYSPWVLLEIAKFAERAK